MNLIQRVDSLMGLLGLEPKASKSSGKAPALPDWWRTIGEQGAWGEGVPDPEIYANQAQRYSTSPAFYAGVNRIAEAGAMTQIKVFAGPEDDAKEINPHPFLDLLKRPAPNMEWLSLDRFTLIESILASLAITGNSYLYLGGRSAPTQAPTMLLPLRPDRLTVLPDKEVGVKGYKYLVGSQEWQIAVADIVHIRRFHPLNDFVGLSQTEPANYALATDFAAQQHNWATFKNSARLSVVIESDAQHIDPADKEMMEQYWRDTYTGDPAKAHQVAFLWGGFKAHDFGMNARDAEYILGRKLNRSDILMTLGIHPGLLMAEDVNLANSKTAEYLFAKYTLLPLISRIIFRLNAEVLPLYGEGQELRAIDVVPRDEIYNAQVAATQAGAAKTLIEALGAKEGIAEAKRQKLLSAEVPEPKEEPEPQPEPPPAPVAPQTPPPPEVEQPEPPKFNPNHDELGRFASGGGATISETDFLRLEDTVRDSQDYQLFNRYATRWTSGSDVDARALAFSIAQRNPDLRRYLLYSEFGLELPRDITLYRVGDIAPDGLASFYARRATAESYQRRMDVDEITTYRARIDDVLPTLTGSGEIWADVGGLTLPPKLLAPAEAADLAAVAEQFARAADALAEAKAVPVELFSGADVTGQPLPTPKPAPTAATHGFTTAMLAFFPTVARPALSDLPDGSESVPDADLHVTLAFLGDTDAQELSPIEIALRVQAAAAQLPVLTGKFGGAVTFTADDQQPFCATIDAPALPAWRAALLRLTGLDAYADAEHGYTPHMTLAYLPAGAQPPTMTAPDAGIVFDTVTLAWNDERYTFPLCGGPVADAGALDAIQRFGGEVVRADPPDAIDPDVVY